MAKVLKYGSEIQQGNTVQSWHVSQSVDAFTGTEEYDITISGSLDVTGSFGVKGDVTLIGLNQSSDNSNNVLLINPITKKLYYTGSYTGGTSSGSSGDSVDIYYEGELIQENTARLNFTGSAITDVSTTSNPNTVTIKFDSGEGTLPPTSYNKTVRYILSETATHRVEVVSSGDYYNNYSWSRNGTSLFITSSRHNLSTGDVIMVRGASSDLVFGAVTDESIDHFSIQVPDTGDISGDNLSYMPLYSASVGDTSGDINGITISEPSTLDNGLNLHSISIYASNQQTTPMIITLPTGTQKGAGEFVDKTSINMPVISGMDITGTGNSQNLTTLNQQWSLGSNFNQLKLTGVDNFSPIILKISFI